MNLNRRDWLKVAGGVAVTTAVAKSWAGAPDPAVPLPAPPRKFRKGYFMGAFPGGKGQTTWLEKFQMVRAAGFEGVEVPSHLDQKEILRARDATGLEIAGVACGAFTRMTSLPSPAQRKVGSDGLMQGMREAKAYGASTVLCVPGGVNASISYADAYARTQDEIRRTIPLAEELGIKIAIENVLNRFLLSPLEAARYVDECRSPAVGWQFDTGNVRYVGWPDQWIRILGGRVLKVHIKEFSRKKMNGEDLSLGFAVDYLEGDSDWRATMGALAESGYAGWCIAEPGFHPKNLPPAERLQQVSEKVGRILAS